MGSDFLYGKIKTDLDELCNDVNVKRSGKGEYITDCPECLSRGWNGYGKLYINSTKSVGYCQRCKSTFINRDKDVDEIFIDSLKTPKFNSVSESFYIDKVDCDYYNYSKDYSENEVNYLAKRNPALLDLYKDLGFKFRKDKIVMPFYWEKEVIYYQVRSTLNRDVASMPYFMPPIEFKPLWINPLNKGSDTLILVEGIFGAIGAWLKYEGKYDVISVQGSHITKYMIWMLGHFLYSKYLMYFDDLNISQHEKQILQDADILKYGNIDIIESKFHDPEDDYLNRTVEH